MFLNGGNRYTETWEVLMFSMLSNDTRVHVNNTTIKKYALTESTLPARNPIYASANST